MLYRHYLLFCTVIHIEENKSIDDSLTIIYFTTSVSKYQERSLFSIQLVSFWNFQKHASTDQMDPSGIHNLFGRSTLIGNNARVRESLPTCPRADERDELSCRDLEVLAYLNDTILLKKVQVIPFNQSESFRKVPS